MRKRYALTGRRTHCVIDPDSLLTCVSTLRPHAGQSTGTGYIFRSRRLTVAWYICVWYGPEEDGVETGCIDCIGRIWSTGKEDVAENCASLSGGSQSANDSFRTDGYTIDSLSRRLYWNGPALVAFRLGSMQSTLFD